VLGKLIDLGISPIVFREVSKSEKNLNILRDAILIRIVAFIALIIIVNLCFILLNVSIRERILLSVLLTNLLFSSKLLHIRELLDIPFKAALNMKLPVIAIIIENILLLTFVVIVSNYELSFDWFVASYVVASIPSFLIMTITVSSKIDYFVKIDKVRIKWLLKQSFPLYLFVLLTAIYQQIDVLFTQTFDSEFATGIYSAALRISMPLVIIPSVLNIVFFPIIVGNVKNNLSNNIQIINLIVKILFLLAFCVAVIFVFKRDEIIVLIFGKDYHLAAIPTALLLFSQIFGFISFIALDIFTAYGQQKYNSYFSFAVLTLHIAFMLVLIPEFSFIGTSISKLVASFLGFVLISYWLSRIKINLNIVNWKLIFGVGLIAISCYFFSETDLIVYLLFSVISCLVIIFILKIITIQEVLDLLRLTKNKEE
jgi:O-antigen/teichoic acid export membrane protein